MANPGTPAAHRLPLSRCVKAHTLATSVITPLWPVGHSGPPAWPPALAQLFPLPQVGSRPLLKGHVVGTAFPGHPLPTLIPCHPQGASNHGTHLMCSWLVGVTASPSGP